MNNIEIQHHTVSIGESITISEILRSYINEIVPEGLSLNDGNGSLNINGSKITFEYTKNILNNSIFEIKQNSIKIDGEYNTNTKNKIYQLLGFNDEQIDRIENNINNANELYKLKETDNIYIKNIIPEEKIVNGLPDFSKLTFNESFALFESLGNMDGPKINPLRFTVNNIEHHPITAAANSGIEIQYINVADKMIRTYGFKNKIDSNFKTKILDKDKHPIFKINNVNNYEVVDTDKVVVLSSKRSIIPTQVHSGHIKLSLNSKVSSRFRHMTWSEAVNAIENTTVIKSLAEKNLLPNNVYFISDIYAQQINNDSLTTLLVRDSFENLITNKSNNTKITEDNIIFPICALWSENLIFKKQSLLEYLYEKGMDIESFYKDICSRLIDMQLSLLAVGVSPESHSQNVMLIVDKNTFQIKGLCLRDNEGAKIDVKKIKELGIKYNGVLNIEELASSPIAEDIDNELRKKFTCAYFYHGLLDATISFLLNELDKLDSIDVNLLVDNTKEIYKLWWQRNKYNREDYKNLMYEKYISHNLLARGLKLDGVAKAREEEITESSIIPTSDYIFDETK